MRCEPIELVCGVDNNYAPHLAVLLASIANTNKSENIRAHILHDAVNEELRERVAASAPSLTLRWYNVVAHLALRVPTRRPSSASP